MTNWEEKFRETLENLSEDLKCLKNGLSGTWEIWEVIKELEKIAEYIDGLLEEYRNEKGD